MSARLEVHYEHAGYTGSGLSVGDVTLHHRHLRRPINAGRMSRQEAVAWATRRNRQLIETNERPARVGAAAALDKAFGWDQPSRHQQKEYTS